MPVLDALPDPIAAIAVSLRGFGGSDACVSGYEPDDFAADIRQVLDHVGVTAALFVGHSMGTLVAQHLAAHHPDRTAGLVLIGGFTQLADDVLDEVRSAVQDLTYPIDDQFVRGFQSSTLAAPIPDTFFDQLVTEGLKATAPVWRAAFAGIRSIPHSGGGPITAPTMLIWGAQDGLVPRAEQDVLLASIPTATLRVYEGAGHSPHWEQPRRVATDIDTFLRQHSTR